MKTERKKVKVKCIESVEIYDRDKSQLLGQVEQGEILTATLFEPSQEYFAEDSKGREIFVGEIDIDEDVRLEPEFQLLQTEHECPKCDGTGFDKIDDKFYDYMTPCPTCHGSSKEP